MGPDAYNALATSSTAQFALGWISGAQPERAYVDHLLQERGQTSRAISTKALQLTLCEIKRVNSMLASDPGVATMSLGKIHA